MINGITFLHPKNKILTSVRTEHIYAFLIPSGIFPDEQKPYKAPYGFKDQLVINKIFLVDCHNKPVNSLDILRIGF